MTTSLPRPKILLVDDDPVTLHWLGNLLKDMAQLHVCTRADQALQMALSTAPDLALLDVEMPGISGLELCAQLKASPALADVLVLFVTSHDDAATETLALSAGAIDFIHKPAHADVVRARVRNYLAMKQHADALRAMAAIDGLTGIANRRAFDARAALEVARIRRGGVPLALLLCDVDHFKLYNDAYGHPAGDACLRSVASALASQARRAEDLAARLGGEEFGLLLPGCSLDAAYAIAEGFGAAVRALCIPHARSTTAPHVTVSVGVAALPPSRLGPTETDVAALLAAADGALYEAKHGGRDQARQRQLD